MRDRVPLLLVAALLFGALGLGALAKRSQRGDFADDLSTWRSRESGARALYLLAEQQGLQVERRTRPVERLERSESMVFLGRMPSVEALTPLEAGARDNQSSVVPVADAGADGGPGNPAPEADAGVVAGDCAPTSREDADSAEFVGDAAAPVGQPPDAGAGLASFDAGLSVDTQELEPSMVPQVGASATAGDHPVPAPHDAEGARTASAPVPVPQAGEDVTDKGASEEAYDEEAYDEEAYDEEAYDEEAYDEEAYDEEAYDEELEALAQREKAQMEVRDALLAHLQRGGKLLLAPSNDQRVPLLDTLGITLVASVPDLGDRSLVPAQVTPWTLGVQHVEGPIDATLQLPLDAVPILVDFRTGLPVAAWLPVGTSGGGLFVFTAPQAFDNTHLARAHNARFALQLLNELAREGRRVQFDEYHHGFRNERSLVDFLKRYGVQFALLQLLLGLLFWILALRRFGPPQAPEEEARNGRADLLAATANLYRGGRHHQGSAEQLARWLTLECAALAGVRAHAGRDEVLEGLRVRGLDTVADALSEVWELAQRARTERDVLATARATSAAMRRLKNRQRGAEPMPARKDDAA